MKENKQFGGFTPSTINFFKDLEENNYKEWFEEHRDVYEKDLIEPFRLLIAALLPVMYNIDAHFEQRPHRILSRIYRDIRFSKDKTPYKPYMWMSFEQANTDWRTIPIYYLELNAHYYSYGMGYVEPNRKTLNKVRDHMSYDIEEFDRQTTLLLDNGFKIGGEIYKRPVKNELSENLQTWAQRKAIYLYKKESISEILYSSYFAQCLINEFESLSWLYNFFKDE